MNPKKELLWGLWVVRGPHCWYRLAVSVAKVCGSSSSPLPPLEFTAWCGDGPEPAHARAVGGEGERLHGVGFRV